MDSIPRSFVIGGVAHNIGITNTGSVYWSIGDGYLHLIIDDDGGADESMCYSAPSLVVERARALRNAYEAVEAGK